MFLGKVAFSVSVPAKVHAEHKHTSHEDCAVPHAGPIHGPGIDVVCAGAHDNIPEHPIHCQHQIRMVVQGI